MGGARTCGSNWGDKPPPYPTAPTLHQLEWASVGRTPQHAAPPISSNKPRPRPSTHPCTYITGPDWLTGDQAGSSGWRRANQREGPQDRRHSLQWQVNIYIVKKRNEKPRRSRCGGLSLVVLVIKSTQADTAAWVTLWCIARRLQVQYPGSPGSFLCKEYMFALCLYGPSCKANWELCVVVCACE